MLIVFLRRDRAAHYGDFSRIIQPKIGMYRMLLGDRFEPLVYRFRTTELMGRPRRA